MTRLLFALIVIATAAVAACATPAPAEQPTATVAAEEFKAAFVYVAPVGDLGWNWAHDQGRQYLERSLGIETAYIENVPEGPEAERVLRDFARKGYDLIFATSYGYMDPTIAVAEEFPDTWFIHISGHKTAENVSVIFGRMDRARFLTGVVAGSMTETNTIGCVVSFPLPLAIMEINAFALGVREVNPDAVVRVVWTNTWYDPPKEKEAAEALLNEGADVICQYQDTPEPQKAAQDAGAYGIGFHSDMRPIVGEAVLVSAVWDWGPTYADITERVMAGTYQSEDWWGYEAAALSPFSDEVPASVRDLVGRYQAAWDAGTRPDVFCGPIAGQGGELVVPEGRCLSRTELWESTWFVDGIEGEAPSDPPATAGQVVLE